MQFWTFQFIYFYNLTKVKDVTFGQLKFKLTLNQLFHF